MPTLNPGKQFLQTQVPKHKNTKSRGISVIPRNRFVCDIYTGYPMQRNGVKPLNAVAEPLMDFS